MTVIFLCFLTVVIQFGTYAVVTAVVSEDGKLEAAENRLYEHILQENPEMATITGSDAYNDRLTSYTLEAFDRRKAENEEMLSSLNSMNYHKLSKHHKKRYHILKDHIQTYLDGYPWREYGSLNPINFLEKLFTMSSTWFKTKGDLGNNFRKFQGRFAAFPNQTTELINLMKRAIMLNRTNYAVSMNARTVNLHLWTDKFLALLRSNDLSLIPDNIKEKIYFQLEHIMDALMSIKRFLKREYLRNTRSEEGLWSLPKGLEYYEACLKFHLGLPLKPKEVHDIGLKEVKRIRNHMQKDELTSGRGETRADVKEVVIFEFTFQVMDEHGFNGTLPDFYNYLRTLPGLYNNSQNQLMAEAKHIVHNVIRPNLWSVFEEIEYPAVRVVNITSSKFPWAFYSNGTFAVNLFMSEERPIFSMMPISLHEADPGHHFQESYSNIPELPLYRKWVMFGAWHSVPFRYPSYTAYVEGWALYSEFLGEEMGLYNDSYTLLGRYVFEIFRASRLVVDTGIHAFGWTKTEALQYFMNYTDFAENLLSKEVDTIITWPGRACSYKIGELKIKELRTQAEEELRKSFNVKKFHDIILRTGPVSLKRLEIIINDWIDETLLASSVSSSVSTGHIFYYVINIFIYILFKEGLSS